MPAETSHDIVHTLPSLETGGAETMAVHLAGELARRGLQTGVISLFNPQGTQLESALATAGVSVWPVGKRLGFDFATIRKIRELVCNIRPSVIHTHLSTLRYIIPAVVGLSAPPRIVHTVHRVAERESEAWLRWLHRWCMRRCAHVVAVSEEVASSCARIFKGIEVSVIPNGIGVRCSGPTPETRSNLRRALGISNDALILCCVARLHRVKNHTQLLQAFSRVAGETGAHLVLAGSGGLRAELEALADNLQIRARTHFLGERRDVSELLAASDIFVLSSLSEGIPLSVLEAMAAGLPVIATSVGGLPEIVRSGVEGILVPPGTVEPLADAMKRMISDDQLRFTMARAAMQKAQKQFDIRDMVRSYVSIYERLGMKLTTAAYD